MLRPLASRRKAMPCSLTRRIQSPGCVGIQRCALARILDFVTAMIAGGIGLAAFGAAPILEPIPDIQIREDTASEPMILRASDADTPGALIQFRATAVANGALLSGGIALSGTGRERTLVITPARNQSGVATVRVQVSDPSGASTSDEFDVRVEAVNDSPELELLNGSSFESVAGANTRFTVRVADVDDPVSNLVVTAEPEQPALVAQSGVTGLSFGRTVDLLAAFELGATRIHLRATDPAGASTERVVDYRVVLPDAVDFGDAPGIYPVLRSGHGAWHVARPTFRLGAAVDSETDGNATPGADGDDRTGIDDEDGVTWPPTIQSDRANGIRVEASAAGLLDGWIDFDRDGHWDNLTEKIFDGVSVAAGANILPFSLPPVFASGVTFARVRLSTTGHLPPEGGADVGEVEDYRIVLAPVVAGLDFGDAPEPYPTTLARDGARHSPSPLMLGTRRDLETDAVGEDDGTGIDDEDGIVPLNSMLPGQLVALRVTTTLAGRLDAWVDFDGNGSWDEPGERIATSVAMPAGINSLSFTVPATASPRTTQARFRLSTVGGLGPTGPATDGEVEDYAFVIEAPPGPCPVPPVDGRTRPNIIVILADDLGFGDLGCYGSRDIPTPNIDSLATGGVRFTSGYVTAPVCSPSRAGLMTGRYQQRFGHETNPGTSLERDPHFGLPVTESTLGDRFRTLEYATGWIGKSHLGGVPEFHPQQRGFQEYFGFIESHHDYFDTGEPLSDQHDPILRGTVPIVETNYLTTAFARECVRFIDAHAAQPFLLYAPFNAIHFPLQATDGLSNRAAALSLPDPRRREIAPVLLGLDDAVGAILSTLRAHHLETNTLIFFTSDNGGTVQLGSINRPFRGGKTEVYEGGIRVPFLMQWTGHLTPGRVFDDPVSTLDILPTAWGAVGLPVPDGWHLDGVNLLPHLCDASLGAPHPTLFWRIETDGLNQGGDVLDGIRAVREGRWKLVKPGVLANWELYDLSVDLGETSDLASARPEVVQHLVAAFHAWSGETARPLWAVDDLDFETPAFVREDIRIGTTGASYLAPQFLPDGSEATFQDELDALWRAAIDPTSGFFASVHGRDQQVDTGIAPIETSATGPQWGSSATGTSLFYTKSVPPSPPQIWRAGPLGPVGSATTATPLTGDPLQGRTGVLPSQESNQPSARLLFGVGQLPEPEAAWSDEATAGLHTTLPGHVPGIGNAHWIPETPDIVYVAWPAEIAEGQPQPARIKQLARFNTAQGTVQYLTDDDGDKSEPWAFRSPEYDGELCYATLVDGTGVAIYRDLHDRPGGLLTRTAYFRLPSDTPARTLRALEPLARTAAFNGTSYFVCTANDSPNPSLVRDSGIWFFALGTDAQSHVLRRLDEGGVTGVPAVRRDPHLVAGPRELRAYFTLDTASDLSQLRLAATGISRPDASGATSGFRTLDFAPSFRAGLVDDAGNGMHGTETLALVIHHGMLFAAQGSRGNVPIPRTPGELANPRNGWTGAQILVKESASALWRVDPASVAIFRDHLRTETLTELVLTTRADGEALREPIALLLAGLSDVGPIGSRQATARVRRDEPPALWEDSHVATTSTAADVLAFGAHLERAGTHFLFAGLSNGEIYRGGYDPDAPGRVRWFSNQAERIDAGPVVGFAEANGILYAATGLHQSTPGGPVVGGLYARADNSRSWTLVHQWPLPTDLAIAPEERWLLRGLTAVPEPHGDSRDVLLAARAWPGVIERIDPHPDPRLGHVVTVELDVRDFLARQWRDDRLRLATVTVGYHGFTPVRDPSTGENLMLVGVWIDAPGLSLPAEGSAFLIRHRDATYEAVDPAALAAFGAVQSGVRGIRTIAPSPFPEDAGAVWYFGGFDATGREAHDTAWIVRGSWSAWPRLSISSARTRGEWQFDWNASDSGWVLEQADDPAVSDRWRRVAGRPTFQQSRRTQLIAAPEANAFFRLRRP